MGLLAATGKAVKKLADEWDEAAWIKENPRPQYDPGSVKPFLTSYPLSLNWL